MIRVGILGSSGYTGGELLRLLSSHDEMKIAMLSADRGAGRTEGEVFPHLSGLNLPKFISLENAEYTDLDAIFCCLPHGTAQAVLPSLPENLKIVDLSADFRLRDEKQFAEFYNREHQAVELQKQAVYGLTELNRQPVSRARLVANPGCYPTGPQLALVPLLKERQIETNIIIDAKSGVSGAGRELKTASLYAEVGEGILAYNVASHRHSPEIDQGLSEAANTQIQVTFTPHLVPMNRGILTTVYLKLTEGTNIEHLRENLTQLYRNDPFIQVTPEGVVPNTKMVRGSNTCLIGIFNDRVPNRILILTAIDNLVKGASGQALQNMNLMFGIPETAGLLQSPLFP